MQINGALPFPAVVSPRSSDARGEVRPPVVIDVDPSIREPRALLPATEKLRVYQTALADNDRRQAQFVRLFADNKKSEAEVNTDNSAVPKGIQQYLKIASLEPERQQRAFDALV